MSPSLKKLLGIPVGLITANFTEWAFHKFVLHGLGKKKSSFWSGHWAQHHRDARKNGMIDQDYAKPFPQVLLTSEGLALLLGSLAISPLILKFPGFVGAAWAYQLTYFLVHRKAHQDPPWANKWLPWHVQHHFMDQNKNWNVVFPLTDWILGTLNKK